jgi:hypothetical protein
MSPPSICSQRADGRVDSYVLRLHPRVIEDDPGEGLHATIGSIRWSTTSGATWRRRWRSALLHLLRDLAMADSWDAPPSSATVCCYTSYTTDLVSLRVVECSARTAVTQGASPGDPRRLG